MKQPKKPNDNLIYLIFEASQDEGIHIKNYAVCKYADGKTFYFQNKGFNSIDNIQAFRFILECKYYKHSIESKTIDIKK